MPFGSLQSMVLGMTRTLHEISKVYGDGKSFRLRNLPRTLLVNGKTITKKSVVTYISKLKRVCNEGLPCPIKVRYDRGVVVEVDEEVIERYMMEVAKSRANEGAEESVTTTTLERAAENLYERLRKEVRELYGGVIKSPVALDAIAWVVSRATYVDEPFFPLTVESIGLMGSVFWKKDPNDIDIVIAVRENSVMDKYREFVDKRLWNYANIIVNECSGRRSSVCIPEIEDRLRNAGADDTEILWLRYIPLKSYYTSYFSGSDSFSVVVRFIKGGWSKKRLEIHNAREEEHIPYVTIWVRGSGFAPLARDDVDAYIEKARKSMKQRLMDKIYQDMLFLRHLLKGDDYVTETLKEVVSDIVENLKRATKTGSITEMSRESKLLTTLTFVHDKSSIVAVLKTLRNLYSKGVPLSIITELEERIASVGRDCIRKHLKRVVREIHGLTNIKDVMVFVEHRRGNTSVHTYVGKINGSAKQVNTSTLGGRLRELFKELEKLAQDYCALSNFTIKKVVSMPIPLWIVNVRERPM